MQQSYDNLIEKWSPVLNEESAGAITDYNRRAVTAAVLERTLLPLLTTLVLLATLTLC